MAGVGNASTWAPYNVTAADTLPVPVYTPEKIVLAGVLTILDLVTFLGNLLVLLSFYFEPKLRSQSFNYYIFNLAITDFLVAVTAMTFYTIDTVLGYWPFGVAMCGVWIFFDFALTFASVFTVVAISVDRLWSVTWPNHYRTHNTRRKTATLLVVVWICVFVLWTPPFIMDRLRQDDPYRCIWEPSENQDFVLVVIVIGHYVPCTIMVGCYIKVSMAMMKLGKVSANRKAAVQPTPSAWSTATSRVFKTELSEVSQQQSLPTASVTVPPNAEDQRPTDTNRGGSSSSRERRAFVTLSYILASYMVCWFPFYVLFDIYAWRPDLVPEGLYICWFWITYANSALNPVLYAFSSKDFRLAFKKVLLCKK
ncbi:hypothetical protein ScPMuIL_010371 [Solemya velum]